MARSGTTLPATPPLTATAWSASRYCAAVDHRLPRLVGRHAVEDRCQAVDGVGAHPGAGGVGPRPAQLHLELEHPLAAGLDAGAGRLAEDRHVAVQQIRGDGCEGEQAVVLPGDLLAA